MADLSRGIVISFANTPQANADFLTTTGLTEDSACVVYLDVMCNDAGGAAKTLYSLDNGISDGGNRPADLLQQDLGRAEATASDISANGARIWITADGKVGYDAATWSSTFQDRLQALTSGQCLTDSFTYAIRLGNGTLSWTTAKVFIAGADDIASITRSNHEDDAVVEAGGVADPGKPTAGGQLTVHDLDAGQAVFQAAAKDSLEGHYGNFTFNSTTGEWTYTLDQDKADVLKEGQHAKDTLIVTSADGTATEEITVDITGSNDAATITASVNDDISVTEAGGAGNATPGDPDAGGQLSVTDVDAGEAHFQAATQDDLAGQYGSFTFDATSGQWGYTLDKDKSDALIDGEEVFDTLKVESADGTTHQIEVKITGGNDEATISASGSQDIEVSENGGEGNATPGDDSAGGKLGVHDVDKGQAHFQAVANLDGKYGTFSFDKDTGEWAYALDQGKADVLHEGQHVEDTLIVTSADGTDTETITVDITGSNDVATITASVSDDTSVTEAGDADNATPGDPDAGGQLSVTDVDEGEAHFQAATQADLAGQYGSFTFDATSGQWEYTLDQAKADALIADEKVTDTLKVKSTDGTTHLIEVDITGSNDAPAITSQAQQATVSEGDDGNGTSAQGQVTFSDPDQGDAHVFGIAVGAAHGDATVDADGTWHYTVSDSGMVDELAEDQHLSDSFTVRVADGHGAFAQQQVTIDIVGTNDAPVLTGTPATLAGGTEDVAYTVKAADLLAGFTDVDHDTLTVSNLDADHGTVTPGGAGTYTFTPDANYNGTVHLTYTVLDGHGAQLAAQQSFNLAPVNDAPVLTGQQALLPDGTVNTAYLVSAADLVKGYADVEGDALSVSVLAADHGTVVDHLDGTYTIAPDTNYTGTMGLHYNVVDGHGGSVAAGESYLVAGNPGPVFTSSATLGTIREHLINVALDGFGSKSVGTVHADAGNGHAVTYSIVSDSSGGAFKIDAANGAVTVRDISLLDYEAASGLSGDAGGKYYTLDLQANDGSSTSTQVAKVYLTDVSSTVADKATNYYDGDAEDIATKLNLAGGNDVAFGDGGADTIGGGQDGDWIFGGAGNDTLAGEDDDDVLYGGAGIDSLTGGNGADTFVFGSGALGSIDTIKDFSSSDDDKIKLVNDYAGLFTTLGTGALDPSAFDVANLGPAATSATRIVYDPQTGALFYDADGTGGGAAIQFATLGTGNNHPALSSTDFLVGPPPGP